MSATTLSESHIQDLKKRCREAEFDLQTMTQARDRMFKQLCDFQEEAKGTERSLRAKLQDAQNLLNKQREERLAVEKQLKEQAEELATTKNQLRLAESSLSNLGDSNSVLGMSIDLALEVLKPLVPFHKNFNVKFVDQSLREAQKHLRSPTELEVSSSSEQPLTVWARWGRDWIELRTERPPDKPFVEVEIGGVHCLSFGEGFDPDLVVAPGEVWMVRHYSGHVRLFSTKKVATEAWERSGIAETEEPVLLRVRSSLE